MDGPNLLNIIVCFKEFKGKLYSIDTICRNMVFMLPEHRVLASSVCPSFLPSVRGKFCRKNCRTLNQILSLLYNREKVEAWTGSKMSTNGLTDKFQ